MPSRNRYGRTLEERFWARVDRSAGPDACWPWTGTLTPNGYGLVYVDGHATTAHRVAWQLTNGGPIPDGQFALHHCDNRPCCNPAHLFLGTAAENTADMLDKGRGGQTTHPEAMPRGVTHGMAKLDEESVRTIRRELAAGATVKGLARRFGVDPHAIRQVRDRETWRHVS